MLPQDLYDDFESTADFKNKDCSTDAKIEAFKNVQFIAKSGSGHDTLYFTITPKAYLFQEANGCSSAFVRSTEEDHDYIRLGTGFF